RPIRYLAENQKPESPGSNARMGRRLGPLKMAEPVKIQCLKCRYVGRLTGSDLVRRGIRPEAPIASFAKRLRCGKCGSQSVCARRELPQRKAS
ncbi:MAG: hypothetical protein WBF47_23025, partial [Xanthobacteraceae bacterium]